MAGVVAPLIGPGAVHADGKALVLDGAGTQQGVPGQDAFLGPVGGVEDGVVVVTVAAERGEPQVVADEQQYPQAAELHHHAVAAGGVVERLAGVGEQVMLVIPPDIAVGQRKAKAVVDGVAVAHGQRAADGGIELAGLGPEPLHYWALHGLDDWGGVYVLSGGEHLGQDVDIGPATLSDQGVERLEA